MAVNNDVQISVSLKDNATAGLNKLSGEMKNVGRASQEMGNNTSSALSRFTDGLKSAGLATAGFLAVSTILAKNFIDVGASFEQARVSFETMLGSADKARTLLSQISDFARKTPFELPQVVEGAKRLLAYNVAAEDLIPTFRMLGDIAAGVGTDKLPQLILAFGQVKAVGHLTGMELRQFTETGVPMLDLLGRTLGKTTAQIAKMVTDKEISFDNVTEALKLTTSEGGKFFNLMDRQSKTVGGRISNLKDNFTRLKLAILGITEGGDIVKGGLFDRLSVALQNLMVSLDNAMPAITNFFSYLSQNEWILKAIAGALVGLVVLALAPLALAIIPLLPMIAAFAAAGALIAVMWQPTLLFFQNLIMLFQTQFLPWLTNLGIQIGLIFQTVITTINGWWTMFLTFLATIGTSITTWLDGIRLSIQGILTMSAFDWGYFFGMIQLGMTNMVANIGSQLTAAKDLIIMHSKTIATEVPPLWAGWMTTIQLKFLVWCAQMRLSLKQTMDDLKTVSSVGWEVMKVLLDNAIANWKQKWIDGWTSIKNFFIGIIDGMKSAFNSFVNWVGGMIDSLRKKASEFASGLKSGSKKAVGGLVTSGTPYMVGERGPELFVPASSGRIVPNNQVQSSGNTVNLSVNIGVYAGTETEKRRLAEELYQGLVDLATARGTTVAGYMGA